ncbi:MAG: ABC transporter substrate-binding protein [Candidatus Lustribacter sp.]
MGIRTGTRKLVVLTLAGILALMVGGVSEAPAADTYVIPVDLPLTGSGSFFGQGEQQILRLLEKRVNDTGGIHGQPLRFDFLDDQSSPQVAVQVVSGAQTSQPAVILGPGVSAECLATQPLVKNGPVLYCLSPAVYPPAGSFMFGAYMTTESVERATVRYIHDMGWRRIGMLATTDTSGQVGVRGYQRAIAAHEKGYATIVALERFNPDDVSVSAQVARIKAADPQVIIAFAAGAPFGTILRGLRDAGLDLPVDTSSANTTPVALARYSSILPTTLIVNGSAFDGRKFLPPGPLKDACDELDAVLRAGNGGSPGATELLAWDAGRLVVSALRALPAGATAEQLRTYIAQLHRFAGVNGIYDFRTGDQHGLTDTDVVVSQWDAQAKIMVAVSRPGGAPLTQH